MSVIATDLSPMTKEILHGAILLAADALINSLPIQADGSLDLTGVRLTYGDTSFLIETGITEPAVLVDTPPPDAIDASVMGGVV